MAQFRKLQLQLTSEKSMNKYNTKSKISFKIIFQESKAKLFLLFIFLLLLVRFCKFLLVAIGNCLLQCSPISCFNEPYQIGLLVNIDSPISNHFTCNTSNENKEEKVKIDRYFLQLHLSSIKSDIFILNFSVIFPILGIGKQKKKLIFISKLYNEFYISLKIFIE